VDTIAGATETAVGAAGGAHGGTVTGTAVGGGGGAQQGQSTPTNGVGGGTTFTGQTGAATDGLSGTGTAGGGHRTTDSAVIQTSAGFPLGFGIHPVVGPGGIGVNIHNAAGAVRPPVKGFGAIVVAVWVVVAVLLF
jgi:hypothetical protein